MIENKELGLKIAETKEEKNWFVFGEQIKETIKSLENDIKEQDKVLKTPDRKIVQKCRKGANAMINRIKENLVIQEELYKFSQTKLKGGKDESN